MDDIAIYLNRQPSSTSLHYVQGRTWRQRCGSCTRKLHLFRLLLFSRRVCVCVHVSYLQFASQFRARLTLDVPPRRVARKIETIIPDFRREKIFFFSPIRRRRRGDANVGTDGWKKREVVHDRIERDLREDEIYHLCMAQFMPRVDSSKQRADGKTV